MWNSRIVGRGDESPKALNANPLNWRTHGRVQRQSLIAVLDRVGWVQDVVVNQRSGRLVDGHLRVELAVERNEPSIPVLYVDLDDDEEQLIIATLDPIAALAGSDDEALRALLDSIEIEDEAVQELLRTVGNATGVVFDEPSSGETDPDDVPAIGTDLVSAVGDLWLLGEHRVLCGDSTTPSDVERLFGRARAAWMWSDPPYGVEYEGGTAAKLTIANDDPEGIPALLAAAFSQANLMLEAGAPIYCCAPAGRLFLEFGHAFQAVGWHLHETLVWVKDEFVLGHSDYHYRHEPILYGWKPSRRRWVGGRDQSSVFEIARPKASPDHPTGKPVELVEAQLTNSSVRGSIGYDPFLGSGTTLIASERLGRRCYGIEIDPRYVDVVVRRWQTFTRRAAVLDGDGRTYAEVMEARRGG